MLTGYFSKSVYSSEDMGATPAVILVTDSTPQSTLVASTPRYWYTTCYTTLLS
jgi:hypothetical protein